LDTFKSQAIARSNCTVSTFELTVYSSSYNSKKGSVINLSLMVKWKPRQIAASEGHTLAMGELGFYLQSPDAWNGSQLNVNLLLCTVTVLECMIAEPLLACPGQLNICTPMLTQTIKLVFVLYQEYSSTLAGWAQQANLAKALKTSTNAWEPMRRPGIQFRC
jgi:hypothetical protein